MTVAKLVPALLAFAACKKDCPDPLPPPPPPPTGVGEVKACLEPDEGFCPRSSCGANSPSVNNFPTNGVRSDGDCNRDGVQLLPGSVNGGVNGKCSGTTLMLRNNQLVGVNANDNAEVVCTGLELKGATFMLRSWVKKDGKNRTLTVHIADIEPAYHADDNQRPRMAYRMTDDNGQSLCTAKGSTSARTEQLGLKPLIDLTDPGPKRDLIIPIRSELIDRDGHAERIRSIWASKEVEWTHFACVDDALAKRSLYDLHRDDAAMDRAAIMMFTANYCGHFHATGRGREISWEVSSEAGVPQGSRILEAKWGPDGAVCMSSPRELFQEGATRTAPHDPQGDLLTMKTQCTSCTTPEAWAAEMRKCELIKKTTPIPTCEECKTAECQAAVLHSYVQPKTGTEQ